MNLRGSRARRIQEGLEGKEKGRGCNTGHESEILKIFNFRKGTKKNALEKPLGYWGEGGLWLSCSTESLSMPAILFFVVLDF